MVLVLAAIALAPSRVVVVVVAAGVALPTVVTAGEPLSRWHPVVAAAAAVVVVVAGVALLRVVVAAAAAVVVVVAGVGLPDVVVGVVVRRGQGGRQDGLEVAWTGRYRGRWTLVA